ncbi:hypothetical protein JIQ42_05577 [Leishmania sp. Namibia]|uniref:hypothetical protein n=1 Tax=Leishmania sp. Namibia TaxID=2802991 RepID=UPI001B580971|nr:hypothetical protein JIQ42_05577 [Leishmania sp. Namibia]
MSHNNCSDPCSTEAERLRKLEAGDCACGACASAPQLRRRSRVPVNGDTSIENRNVSLGASLPDASVRHRSSTAASSVTLLVHSDAVPRPKATIERALASEGQLEGRSLGGPSARPPESSGCLFRAVNEAHKATSCCTSAEELSWNAMSHRQCSTSAALLTRMQVVAPPQAAAAAFVAVARSHCVSGVETVVHDAGEPARTDLREPCMPSPTSPSPAIVAPLRLADLPSQPSLSAAADSSVSSSPAFAIPLQHPCGSVGADPRETLSSSSFLSPSRTRQVSPATPMRGHRGAHLAEAVQSTSASPWKGAGTFDTPSEPITSASTVAAEQNARQAREGEKRKAMFASGDAGGERDECFPAAKSSTPIPTQVLQDRADGDCIVTSTVADVSAASLTPRDEQRGSLADAQQSTTLALSSPPPSSIVHNSCGIARILQLQSQEVWREGLRAALQQDAEVWVRQVCEEQRLLQAQLRVTQARAAALAKDLQDLRCRGSPSSPLRHQSQPIDSADMECSRVVERCRGERVAEERAYSDERSSATRTSHLSDLMKSAVPESNGRGVFAISAAGGTTDAALGTAYTHELESYVHLLEQHTRALHAEKQQLQLRLDRRTSQLATFQQRYQQNYARLLEEQSALEHDYRKAAEDVEEVVGMLVVARAAERAAMRRAEELEFALEESALHAEALAAALHSQAKEGNGCRIRESAGTVNRTSQPIQVGSHDNESLRCTSGCASGPPSSSAFVSFTERNDTERCIMTADALAAAEAAPSSVLTRCCMGATSFTYPSLSLGASSLIAESPACTRLQAQTTASKHECDCGVQHQRGRTPSSPSPVRPFAAPSPVRTAAEVESNSAAASWSQQGRVGVRLASREAEVLSRPPLDSWQAATTSPTLTPLLVADAIASVATPTTDSHSFVPVQGLGCGPNNGGVSAFTPFTVPLASLEKEGLRSSSVHLPTCTVNTSTTEVAPHLSTFKALLTPRGLESQQQVRALCGGAAEESACDAADEHQLLRFHCTVLELELQAKEAAYKAEKEAWEAALHHAEGVAGAMGEVEARVRQSAAALEKTKGLLREMSRLWSNVVALNEDDVSSDDDDSGKSGVGAAGLVVMDEEQSFLLRYSRAGMPLHRGCSSSRACPDEAGEL